MISYPALALRRSVHRRFFFFLAKGLPPGAVVVYVYGQTDEESFLVVLWSVVSCTHRRFF